MSTCFCSECKTNKWMLKKNGDCNHLLKYRWFHCHQSAREAEKLLNQGYIGSFLVRACESKPGNFVLSVRTKKGVFHNVIRYNNNVYELEKKQFTNLEKLIKHYQKKPIVGKHFRATLCLKQPLNSTGIIASGINYRVKQLLKKKDSGFWEEFEWLQQLEIIDHPYFQKEGMLSQNRCKNRYSNILPYDHTRVKLIDVDPNISGSDYINANYIKWLNICGENNIPIDANMKIYIATQGCLPDTIPDFWKMVWQESCRVIVMIINETEKNKCARYWPDNNVPKDYGTMTVTKLVECPTPQYTIRKLLVRNNKTGLDRKIYQCHYRAWSDCGVPSNPICFVQFLQEINKIQEHLTLALPVNQKPGAILVHCSAGIGRTGTFIIIDMIIDQIKRKGVFHCKIDIPRTIQMVRSQRSKMVQKADQYKFVYLAVQHYVATATIQLKCVQRSINQTHADYGYAQVLDSLLQQ